MASLVIAACATPGPTPAIPPTAPDRPLAHVRTPELVTLAEPEPVLAEPSEIVARLVDGARDCLTEQPADGAEAFADARERLRELARFEYGSNEPAQIEADTARLYALLRAVEQPLETLAVNATGHTLVLAAVHRAYGYALTAAQVGARPFPPGATPDSQGGFAFEAVVANASRQFAELAWREYQTAAEGAREQQLRGACATLALRTIEAAVPRE